MSEKRLTGRRCQCRACGEYFNSVPAFDMHRTGLYMPNERRCLSPEEMAEKGMAVNPAGFWVTQPAPGIAFWRVQRRESAAIADGAVGR